MSGLSSDSARLKAKIHDLALHGAASRDEAHALGQLSYYITGTTLQKLVDAIKETKE